MQRGARRSPERAGVDRDIAPAEEAQSLGSARSQGDVLAQFAVAGILGEHRHADAVCPGSGQWQSRGFPEKGVGQLQKDPGTVAAVRLRAGSAAVTEIDERLNALFDHRMRRPTGDPGDERHSACIVFDGGVEQTSIRGLSA